MQRLTAVRRLRRWTAAAALVCLPAGRGLAQDVEAAKTSRLTGVPLPPGAQRIVKKEFTADAVRTLEALTKQIGKECASPEILVWTGASKPATQDAAKAVTEQLEKAGYECKVDDAPEGLPPVLKKIVAVKNKKQAVLGFWAATDEIVTLAWCQVEKFDEKPADAAPAGAPVPERMPAFPKLAVKPGHVRGTALKMNGKPLVGAEITISGTTMFGQRTSFTAPTDDQGRYELPLPDGVYRLSMATWRTRYDGRTYRLPLRTESGDADMVVAKKGAIGNWVLQVRGKVPDSDLYYGGTVVVTIAGSQAPKDLGWREGMVVEVTLAPQSPLVDGSQGRPILARYRVPSQEGNSAFLSSVLLTIPGVPIGKYSVAARIMETGGQGHPLHAAIDIQHPNTPVDSFQAGEKLLYFMPAEAGGQGVDNVLISLAP